MISVLMPGSFDPPTNGHIDIIEQCSRAFERLVVAVVRNPSKSPMFTPDDRATLLRACCAHLDNVTVDTFDGLLVDYASEHGIDAIVKGLRAVTDFEYEMQMAQMNRELSGIVTLFIATKPEYGYLSSSLVKEVASLGRDISGFVPVEVARALAERSTGSQLAPGS